MTDIPFEPTDVTRETDRLCRWGIRVAWHLSLLCGALVSLLSWTGGAGAPTAVIRGLVTFVAFGLMGWGVNAVMVQAGQREEEASGEKEDSGPEAGESDGGVTEGGQPPVDEASATDGEASGRHEEGAGSDIDPRMEARSDEADYLAEAAS